MDLITLGVISYLIGIVANVMYPYITAYLETNQKFNYKYAISRVIGALLAGCVAVVAPGFTDWLSQTATSYANPGLYFIAFRAL